MMANKRSSYLIKNTFILALGNLFPKIAVFITLPVLTEQFTKAEYGTYDLILTLVTMLLPVATLQIHSAAFRFLIEHREESSYEQEIITNIFAFIIPISIVTLTILFFSLFKLSFPVRIAICTYFFFDCLVGASRHVMRGLGKNHFYSISAFISATGQVLFIFLFVVGFKKNLFGAFLALGIAECISFLFLFFVGKIYTFLKIQLVCWLKMKEMILYSWPLIVNNMSSWAMRASNRFIISATLGLAMNGIFAVAYKIPAIISLADGIFNMSWQENASMTSNDSDVSTYYTRVFDQLYRLVTGLLSILIALTPLLFKILVKGNYDEAYPQILILSISMMFAVLSSFWGGIYVAFKRTVSVGSTAVLAALLNILLTFIFIKIIGLYAASIATFISYFALCLYRLFDSRKIVILKYNLKLIVPVFLIVVVEALLCSQRFLFLDLFNILLGCSLFVILNRVLISSMYGKIITKIVKNTK